MSDLIDAEGFRANVGIILMHHDEVFLGRRAGGRGWQFPQGGVRRGESLEQALYRELEEEIGIAKSGVSLVGQTERWLRYRLPARYVRRNQQPVCIGQKQRWFLLRVKGEVSFDFKRTDDPEFDEGRWVKTEPGKRAEQLIVQGRQVSDRGERRKIYADLQRLCRDEGPFIIPNFFNSLYATQSYVNDWPTRAITTEMRAENCWLSPEAPGRKV